ncbi:MAG TPA: protein kinase [Candidatus Sulfopaludibacter sp.]|jgi:Tol biopolymer transport system component|nr:protein kinase [Candidatus Sulfopaludibacter sp.]
MSPQESIAHYRVVSKLGEGGMGAVYRATDTKLHREVAIKVLPEAFAADPDRMARFTREAQVLASLNHPNIAAIYGVEERALVLELVEGVEPAGPLPEAEALPIIQQFIDALEYAHERGVIHRDLKPANLKLTPDGRLKVLDFGLAKAFSGDLATSDPASSPTLTMRATMAGVIMGTAAYMAPEQARGHNVDKRADIWSFGVVVYELLTGKQLFAGETVTDILASVLREEPVFSQVPPRFHRLLRLCLTRDPHRRLRDISGARLLLDEPLPTAPPTPRRSWLPWVVAGLCALAAAAATTAWLTRGPAESGAGLVQFLIPLPSGTSLPTSAAATQWVPSPDGRSIAIVAETDGSTAIWVRSLGDTAVRRLDKTEGGELPFWSPDGKFLAFFTDSHLKRVELSSGGIQTICSFPAENAVSLGDGGAWNSEGTIVFSAGRRSGLLRVPAVGGAPEPATKLADGEIAHSWPQFLPDGHHVIYLARASEAANNTTYVQDLGSAKRVQVIKNNVRTIWAAPGYLLFTREGVLFAQPFNLNSFHLEGKPSALQEDVVSNANNGRSTVAVSQNGVLVYRNGRRTGDRQLSWRDRAGKVLALIGGPGPFLSISLSPDEKSLAMVGAGASAGDDAFIMDIATGVLSPLTHDGKLSILAPVWSPDSKRIAVTSATSRLLQIDVASGKTIAEGKSVCSVQDWTPDGNSILCTSDTAGSTRAFLLPLAGESPGQTILNSPYNATYFRSSPDGKYVAYSSFESGKPEIVVAAVSPSAAKRRISTAGGRFPIWARNTNKLYYRELDGMLVKVEVRTGSNIEAGLPKPLFSFGGGSTGNRFAVSADGQRFVVSEFTRKAEIDRPEISVMLNWTAALRK